jgi:hypothetical protein
MKMMLLAVTLHNIFCKCFDGSRENVAADVSDQ